MQIQNQQKVIDWKDHEFDGLYDEEYRRHSLIHWTPIEAAKKALEWLNVTRDTHTLDIGSGIGKFCSFGAIYTDGQFTGVENRLDLIEVANSINKKLNIKNAEYVHSNITEIDFRNYDSFYYYNPFCEYISISGSIDDSISYSPEKHREYEDSVIEKFQDLPINTKVVTYCSEKFAFPDTYELKELKFKDRLALWIKTK